MARQNSLQALERKIRQMQAQVAKLKQADKPGVREVLALLKKHGLSLSDVKAAMEAAKPNKPKGRKVKPKYRNPNDGAQTWTGRGRMPLWMADLVKKGGKRENFLIGTARSNGGRIEPDSEGVQATARAAAVHLHEMSGKALGTSGIVSGLEEEVGHA